MQNRRAAFTLVELLVVVAIIAVLAALLMPAVSRSYEAGKKAMCLSNLRQLAMAHDMYLSANKDRFITHPKPHTSVMLFGGRGGTLNGYRTADGAGPADRPLNPYVNASKRDNDDVLVFRCPSDHGQGDLAFENSSYERLGTSYVYNRWAADGRPTLNPTPIYDSSIYVQNVKDPTVTVLMAEHSIYNYLYRGDRIQRWHNWNKPTSMVLFVDAHVGGDYDVSNLWVGGAAPSADTNDYYWHPLGRDRSW